MMGNFDEGLQIPLFQRSRIVNPPERVSINFRPEADLIKYIRTNRQLKRVPSELLA